MTWEERFHPLREEWIVVAAHRQDRPWSGGTIRASEPRPPPYVEGCYLCPGNGRVSGRKNEQYTGVFVFDNDHPCVGPDAPSVVEPPTGIYRAQPAYGVSRVICYSPRHDLALAELPLEEIKALLEVWKQQYLELGRRPEIRSVLIFENRGEAVGVSNPHPHCQLYATNFGFKSIELEIDASRRHLATTGRVLFQDILAAERSDGRRLLFENGHAIAFVPFFARYAYETFVAPKRSVVSLDQLSQTELHDFAEALKDVLVRFDNLWEMPFPYVMALHQAPTDGDSHAGFHFHIEFHPPLRKPTLLKYLAGPEIGGGNFISDTSPENTARELSAKGGPHYRQRAR